MHGRAVGLFYTQPTGQNQILNHFLKRPGPDRLVQKAVKMVTSPSHWLTRHTFIALCSAARFYCPLLIFKPRVYQLAHQTYVSGKHMSLPTLSLSVPPLSHSHLITHTHLRACACPRLLARTHTQLGSRVYSLACIIIKRNTVCVCVCTVIIKLSVILSLLSSLDVCQCADNYLSGQTDKSLMVIHSNTAC